MHDYRIKIEVTLQLHLAKLNMKHKNTYQSCYRILSAVLKRKSKNSAHIHNFTYFKEPSFQIS